MASYSFVQSFFICIWIRSWRFYKYSYYNKCPFYFKMWATDRIFFIIIIIIVIVIFQGLYLLACSSSEFYFLKLTNLLGSW